jgi:hypothetical protein
LLSGNTATRTFSHVARRSSSIEALAKGVEVERPGPLPSLARPVEQPLGIFPRAERILEAGVARGPAAVVGRERVLTAQEAAVLAATSLHDIVELDVVGPVVAEVVQVEATRESVAPEVAREADALGIGDGAELVVVAVLDAQTGNPRGLAVRARLVEGVEVPARPAAGVLDRGAQGGECRSTADEEAAPRAREDVLKGDGEVQGVGRGGLRYRVK